MKTTRVRLNAGELSPLLMARADLDAHGGGLARMENWLPLVQGGAARRPGTRYMGPIAGGRRLVPFVAGPDAAYVLVFDTLSLSVWTPSGPLLGDDGRPLALPTPYTKGDLIEGLSVAQSADVMWVCHPRHAPRLVKRTSRATFGVEVFDPDDGPFEDPRRTKPHLFEPLDPSLRLVLAANPNADGTSDLVSDNGQAFYPEQEGRLIRLRLSGRGAKPWEPGKPVDGGDLRRVEGRIYQASPAGGTTGTIRPTHTRGTVDDGGVSWTYLFAGALTLRVEDYQNGSKVKVRVVPEGDLPPVTPALFVSLYGSTDNHDVEFSAWDGRLGWPSAVAFYQERLVFARGQDLFFSRAGDFWSFADATAGETLADDAIAATIAQDRVEAARWLAPFGGRLVVGTEGGLLACGPATSSEPFGPGNLAVEPQTRVACARVRPCAYEGRLAFVQGAGGGGGKLREAAFSLEADGLVAPDMSVLAEHLGAEPFKDLAYQSEPDPTLWVLRGDGLLLSCARSAGENVTAWARHPLPGGWRASGLAVVPEAGAERVWLALTHWRHGGAIVRLGHRREAEGGDWPCLDLLQAFRARVDANGLGGLDAFEGEDVRVRLFHGPWLPPRRVTNGRVAIAPAERVVGEDDEADVEAGLAYASVLETPPLHQTGRGRVHKVGVACLLPPEGRHFFAGEAVPPVGAGAAGGQAVAEAGAGLRAGQGDATHPVFKARPGLDPGTGAGTARPSGIHRATIACGGGFSDAAALTVAHDGADAATLIALTAEWEAS